MKVEAIVPAAGLGVRMRSAIPKPLLKIGGKPILVHTLSALFDNKFIGRVLIAVNRHHMNQFKQALRPFKAVKGAVIIPGGRTRRESVWNCLKEVSADTDIVLIHDAVRPFIGQALINKLIRQAFSHGAAVAAVPVKSTIKLVNDKSEACRILDRHTLYEIQTPQVFRKNLIIQAHRRFPGLAVTDDSSLAQRAGVKVKAVKGSYYNIKVTTPEDLFLAEAILKKGKLWVTA